MEVSLDTARKHLFSRMAHQWTTHQRWGATPCWIGGPGLGKTSVMVDTARRVADHLTNRYSYDDEFEFPLLVKVVTLADREVTDIRGIAIPNKGASGMFDHIRYTRSGILPTEDEEARYRWIMIVLDEVPAATLDHIKTARAPVLDYVVGDTVLDPGRYFIGCTGNDPKHKSGAMRLPAHFVNAVAMLSVQPDVRPFLEWAAGDDACIPPIGRAFVESRASLFTDTTIPDAPNTPFATVRSFTLGLQDLMATYGETGVRASEPEAIDAAFHPENAPNATAILSSYVNDGVATEFMAFGKVRDKLTPLSEILDDPDHCRVPDDLSATFAQGSYLVSWVNRTNVSALIRFTNRLRRDLRVSVVAGMMKRDSAAVTSCAEFAHFARANAGLLQSTLAAKR